MKPVASLSLVFVCLLPLACGAGSADGPAGPFASGGSATGGGPTATGGDSTLAAGAAATGAVGGSTGGSGDPLEPTGGVGSGGVAPGSYALPPPSECSNQFSVQGCRAGDPTSTCAGVCSNDYGPTSRNACEDPSSKPGVPVQFACPRHILFASEMEQAVADDGYAGRFHYAIVGHDPDYDNLDRDLPNSCCQCYQLVFDRPTYLTNSTLTPPPPLIVQSANTAASGPAGFDVFMGAGGLGVFNACQAGLGLGQSYGDSQYLTYPSIGQAFNGGVKPGPDSVNCADSSNNLSDALIAAESCQTRIAAACQEITAENPAVQEETRKSCLQSNQASSYYHENWDVYAKRVACPSHLTEVTGCKPEADGAPPPEPEVQTAAQAAAAGFSSGYHTTTMQDCCMPTCAWSNNVQISTRDGYNSFYSCLADGTPVTR